MRAATHRRALIYTTEDLTWKCRNLLEISHEKCKALLITVFVTWKNRSVKPQTLKISVINFNLSL